MTSPLDVYKALRNIKETLFLGRTEEAFSELRKLLSELPQDVSIDWFACNVIDVANCSSLLKFYDEFRNYFTFVNCSNLHKLVTCLALRGYSEDLREMVRAVVNQGKGRRLFEVIDTKSKDAVEAVYRALKEVGELDLASSLLNEACRGGIKELCSPRLQAMYA